jgi:hypothetical protein
MSELGHSRHSDCVPITSGLPPEADIFSVSRHVLKVPGPDILGKMLPPQGIGHVAQSLDSVNSCKYPSPTPLRSSSDFSFQRPMRR